MLTTHFPTTSYKNTQNQYYLEINWHEIETIVASATCQVLVILHSCYSGLATVITTTNFTKKLITTSARDKPIYSRLGINAFPPTVTRCFTAPRPVTGEDIRSTYFGEMTGMRYDDIEEVETDIEAWMVEQARSLQA